MQPPEPWSQLAVELACDSTLDRHAGALGQHDQAVEFPARDVVGTLTFLRCRRGVRHDAERTFRAAEPLLIGPREVALPSSDCFGLRNVERGHVLLDGVAVLPSDVGVA